MQAQLVRKSQEQARSTQGGNLVWQVDCFHSFFFSLAGPCTWNGLLLDLFVPVAFSFS